MATTDYRYDPFQDVLNTVNISGETHTIPSVSTYIIRLNEVPLKNNPSSITLTIGGVRASEVSAQPAAGEFWPDYSTGADNDETWNTGTMLFNAVDAGKTVVVSYKGTGNMVWAKETSQVFVFYIAGTHSITAPPWATGALLSGCGGGGGGGSGGGGGRGGGCAGGHVINYYVRVTSNTIYTITVGKGGNSNLNPIGDAVGATGGITSFGSLLSLGGGGGGGDGDIGSSPVAVGYIEASGNGGCGFFGRGGTANNPGFPGSGCGSGGGGTWSNGYRGGNGAPGILIVQWVR